eukprot:5637464-Lingulodinium_polyedra.AAC.1
MARAWRVARACVPHFAALMRWNARLTASLRNASAKQRPNNTQATPKQHPSNTQATPINTNTV